MLKKERLVKSLFLFLAIAISVSLFIFKDFFIGLKGYGYLGIFLISAISNATILIPIPSFFTVFSLGHVYDPLSVGIIAAAGGALGELTGYAAGIGGKAIIGEKRLEFERVEKFIDKYGIYGVAFLAAIPNPLFDIVGITAGVLGLKIHQFLFATWVGQIIKFTIIAKLGAASLGSL
jgi:membrane protein YqaA with SNARE-associated domain